MYRNCASRPGCCVPSRALALPCRLNPCSRSRSPTVSAPALCPWAVSSAASAPVDFTVHRNGEPGSPRSSGSTTASSAGTSPRSTSAAFLPPPARPPRPPQRLRPRLQLFHPRRHRRLPDPGRPRHQPDPAITQRPRLRPQNQAPLPLIQMRQDHPILRRQQLLGNFHPPTITPTAPNRENRHLFLCTHLSRPWVGSLGDLPGLSHPSP